MSLDQMSFSFGVDSTTAVYPLLLTEDGGSIPTSTLQTPAKAWQRIRRERMAREDEHTNLFGRWWESLDTRLEKARVLEIDIPTARQVVLQYEWMQSMPAIVLHCYGLYFDNDALGGVVVYGTEYSENLGVWDRYGFTGKMILLSRGVCVHWAHPHSGSFLIRRSLRMLPVKYEVVTATVDPLAGEVGTIYQACGFTYVGSMDSHSRGMAGGWEIHGKLVTERSLRARFGDRKFSPEDVLRHYPNAVSRPQAVKGRYFCFRGEDQERHREAIAHWVQPYPKRTAEEATKT